MTDNLQPKEKYFEWVAACCALLGWPKQRGVDMMPAADPSWFFCFDDGMTPEQAVDKYKLSHDPTRA